MTSTTSIGTENADFVLSLHVSFNGKSDATVVTRFRWSTLTRSAEYRVYFFLGA